MDEKVIADRKEDSKEPMTDSKGGKRKRKTMERYVPVESQVKKKAFIGLPGAGTILREIGNININIGKADNEKMIALHKIIFSTNGRKLLRKKNIRNFSGIQESEVEGVMKRMEKLSTADLKFCASVLDIIAGTTKAKIMSNISDFLKKPSVEKTKNKKSIKKKRAVGKKKKAKSSDKGTRVPSGYILFCNDVRSSTVEKNPELKATEIMSLLGKKWKALKDSQKAKWIAKSKKMKEAKGVATTTKPKSKPKKKKENKPKPENYDDAETDSDDDAPLGKSILGKLKDSATEILQGADLSKLSIKSIRKKLAETYGEDVVKEHKAAIKTHIKEYVDRQ